MTIQEFRKLTNASRKYVDGITEWIILTDTLLARRPGTVTRRDLTRAGRATEDAEQELLRVMPGHVTFARYRSFMAALRTIATNAVDRSEPA